MVQEKPLNQNQERRKNTLPSIADLIAEPTLDTLTGYAEKYGVIKGKFVRIGDVIIVAPAVECQPYGYEPQHKDILYEISRVEDEELKSKISASSDQSDSDNWLMGQAGLTDAGWFYFSYRNADDNYTITSLGVAGQSSTFGRANETERQRTAYLISGLTGLQVEVADHFRT